MLSLCPQISGHSFVNSCLSIYCEWSLQRLGTVKFLLELGQKQVTSMPTNMIFSMWYVQAGLTLNIAKNFKI